jgi:hypothetical protein
VDRHRRATVLLAVMLSAGAGAATFAGPPAVAAAATSASTAACDSPALVVGTSSEHLLQVGFTRLGSQRLRELRVHAGPAGEAVTRPDTGILFRVRSSSERGVDPVVVTVPSVPAGMAAPVSPAGPLPDKVSVVALLVDPTGEPTTLSSDVDLGTLRAATAVPATVTVGCGDDPAGQLSTVLRALGIGAGLFIIGSGVLLLVLDVALLGLRRAVHGAEHPERGALVGRARSR